MLGNTSVSATDSTTEESPEGGAARAGAWWEVGVKAPSPTTMQASAANVERAPVGDESTWAVVAGEAPEGRILDVVAG